MAGGPARLRLGASGRAGGGVKSIRDALEHRRQGDQGRRGLCVTFKVLCDYFLGISDGVSALSAGESSGRFVNCLRRVREKTGN